MKFILKKSETLQLGMIPIGKTANNQEDVSKSCDILYSKSMENRRSNSYLSKSVAEPAFEINSPKTSRCNSETDDTISKDLVEMLQKSSVEMVFNKQDARKGSSLDKLLELQSRLRQLKSIQSESEDLVKQISIQSADCFNYEAIPLDQEIYLRSSESLKATSMGRTLNRLLYEDKVIIPKVFIRSFELRQQLESVTTTNNTLKIQEHKVQQRLKSLKDQLEKLKRWRNEHNEMVQREQEQFQDSQDLLEEEKEKMNALEPKLVQLQRSLAERQSHLFLELREIFHIVQVDQERQHYCINRVFLPNLDYLKQLKRQSEELKQDSLSAALSFVTQVIQVVSRILDVPLR